MVNSKRSVKKLRNRHVCGRFPRILDVEENDTECLFETLTNRDSKKKSPCGI